MSFPIVLAVFSFAVAGSLTPLMRRFALRIGMVDRPDGHRKLHGRTVPLCGGLVILVSLFATICVFYSVSTPWTEVLRQNSRFLLGLMAGTVLICGIGLIDDRYGIRGRQKLAGQTVAALFVIASGLYIERIELFGYRIELGLLAVPFTLAWLLGAINALNLIDGVDGLATTVGVIFSIAIAAMAWLTNHSMDAVCAMALAGSLMGFLIYNLPPARVFLGDAGSMTIGLILGVLAIRSSLKGPATLALAAPAAIWAIPIFDVTMAMVRRKLTGQSVYTTDRGHIHHLLERRGFSHWGVVLFVGILCCLCALAALASVAMKSELMALATVAAILATLIATRFFGFHECRLLVSRSHRFLMSLINLSPAKHLQKEQPVVSVFQGNREWDRLWQALIDFSERFDIDAVQLNVNSPLIGEDYHILWQRRNLAPDIRHWRTEIPLFVEHLSVGKLILSGRVVEGPTFQWMAQLIEGLKPFEEQMIELLEADLERLGMTRPDPATRTEEPAIVN